VARDKTVDEMRAELGTSQALLGRLRGFQPQAVEFLWYRCRMVAALSQFEHAEATILLTLCPYSGAWRMFQSEIKPVMTPAFFERMVRLVVSTNSPPGSEAAVQCPAALPPVGGTVTCRLSIGGRTKELRVRRATESGVEVSGLE
jgi:hypothetical protein